MSPKTVTTIGRPSLPTSASAFSSRSFEAAGYNTETTKAAIATLYQMVL
jgi:hypothetical protein